MNVKLFLGGLWKIETLNVMKIKGEGVVYESR